MDFWTKWLVQCSTISLNQNHQTSRSILVDGTSVCVVLLEKKESGNFTVQTLLFKSPSFKSTISAYLAGSAVVGAYRQVPLIIWVNCKSIVILVEVVKTLWRITPLCGQQALMLKKVETFHSSWNRCVMCNAWCIMYIRVSSKASLVMKQLLPPIFLFHFLS